MADDQTPKFDQDPEVVAAEAVEAPAHEAVAVARSDALARAKHARDLAALSAALAARATPVPPTTPDPVPVVVAVPDPKPVPAPVATPEVEAPAPVETAVSERTHADPEPAPEPVAETVPEPAPPPPEPRSRRAPFASGRTKAGPRTFDAASGAVVSRPLHEWLRVRAELTDAEAADGEAGGARLQALVAIYGGDATWATGRPA